MGDYNSSYLNKLSPTASIQIFRKKADGPAASTLHSILPAFFTPSRTRPCSPSHDRPCRTLQSPSYRPGAAARHNRNSQSAPRLPGSPPPDLLKLLNADRQPFLFPVAHLSYTPLSATIPSRCWITYANLIMNFILSHSISLLKGQPGPATPAHPNSYLTIIPACVLIIGRTPKRADRIFPVNMRKKRKEAP